MMAVNYKTKKELKENIGKNLKYIETSIHGPEYRSNGKFCVVGPSPYNRKFFAEITMKDDKIFKIS